MIYKSIITYLMYKGIYYEIIDTLYLKELYETYKPQKICKIYKMSLKLCMNGIEAYNTHKFSGNTV